MCLFNLMLAVPYSMQVLYDVDYDDGDREEGVKPENVRPLARLLTKASRELQVGDEAIVCFRGRQQQRYLATITARHHDGEKVCVNGQMLPVHE